MYNVYVYTFAGLHSVICPRAAKSQLQLCVFAFQPSIMGGSPAIATLTQVFSINISTAGVRRLICPVPHPVSKEKLPRMRSLEGEYRRKSNGILPDRI